MIITRHGRKKSREGSTTVRPFRKTPTHPSAGPAGTTRHSIIRRPTCRRSDPRGWLYQELQKAAVGSISTVRAVRSNTASFSPSRMDLRCLEKQTIGMSAPTAIQHNTEGVILMHNMRSTRRIINTPGDGTMN